MYSVMKIYCIIIIIGTLLAMLSISIGKGERVGNKGD